MLIITYSETDDSNLSSRLGRAEYSYYFIFAKYRPVLQRLGTLVSVRDPATEVDALYAQARARGESAVFLSFSPPHRTEPDLRCPTVCVLAWEFSSIPDEAWGGEPRNNWVETLAKIGNVITISPYSTDVIHRQVPGLTRIATIPAPIRNPLQLTEGPNDDAAVVGFGRTGSGRTGSGRTEAGRTEAGRSLSVVAQVIDSNELDIRDDVVWCLPDKPLVVAAPVWDGEPAELFFKAGNSGSRHLVGFHDAEEWGSWARSDCPWISLPFSLVGSFTLELDLVPYAENSGRTLHVTIGNRVESLQIEEGLRSYQLSFTHVEAGSTVAFSGFVVGHTLNAPGLRALSLGIARLRVTPSVSAEAAVAGPVAASATVSKGEVTELAQRVDLQFAGRVYTTILNPEDGRKNWEDIVTAFCFAFRDDSSKTLVLKLTCPDMSPTWGRLFHLFSQLNPFACRVVVIHGFLSADEMGALVEVTDFVVNASSAEGQCLPLLEFMSAGVPAIAPCHTAMASYINPENAIVLASSKVNTCWPQDPRGVERTFCYRIDWESLRECFVQSAALMAHDSAGYQGLSQQAFEQVSSQFSEGQIESELERYLRPFDVAAAQ